MGLPDPMEQEERQLGVQRDPFKSKPLARFARNVVSQFGEDGIIEEIFARIGDGATYCVEFGAWDGKHLSNTWNLWHNLGWSAVLIEGHEERFETLRQETHAFPKVTAVNVYVAASGEHNLDRILSDCGAPSNFDLLSIDIDGDDYYVFESLRNFLPRLVILEFNPTIPPELDIVQSPGEYFGASARAMVRLAETKGYTLACMTETNCFFVNNSEFRLLGVEQPTLESVFPRNNLTYVINTYDGLTLLNRKPTYSPPLTPLSSGGFLREAVRRISSAYPRGATAQGLHPAQIFEVGSRLDHGPFTKGIVRLLRRGHQRFVIGLPKCGFVQAWKKLADNRKLVREWERQGEPVPPPHLIKQQIIREHARRFGLKTLIETGTYLGEMVEAMSRVFQRIYSIELDPTLFAQARDKFQKHRHITILQGDSGEVLPEVLAQVIEPSLLWLDSHYSGGNTAKGKLETPIMDELQHVLNHPLRGHVILIDDARCFNGQNDYPTLEELETFVRNHRPDMSFRVEHDVIRICPARTGTGTQGKTDSAS